MNWNYISGFFDADGSITFIKAHRNGMKTPQISFSNNEKDILIEIKDFIQKELDIKGFICKKVQGKYINYELKYTYLPKIMLITNHMKSIHPKKKFRIHLIRTELINIIPRNGKYNNNILIKYNEFEKQFFSTFQ